MSETEDELADRLARPTYVRKTERERQERPWCQQPREEAVRDAIAAMDEQDAEDEEVKSWRVND